MEIGLVFKIFIIPLVGLILPMSSFLMRIRGIYLTRHQFLKFVFLFLAIFLGTFILLTFLSGGIAKFFFLEKGLFIDDYEIRWHITNQWAIIILLYPGTTFFVLSLIMGISYSIYLTFPAACKIPNSEKSSGDDQLTKISNAGSSMGAFFSASASIVSCCSPSLVALISPFFSSLLGSFIPQLLIFSLVMVNYSYFKIAFPKLQKTVHI